MKDYKLFPVLLLFFISSCSNSIESSSYSLSAEAINFKSINYNDTLNGEIFIRNHSKTHSIKIISLEGSCGCTSAFANDSLIKPLDSLKIKFAYIPRMSSDSGSVTKYFTIRTNSAPAFKNFQIKGIVLKK